MRGCTFSNDREAGRLLQVEARLAHKVTRREEELEPLANVATAAANLIERRAEPLGVAEGRKLGNRLPQARAVIKGVVIRVRQEHCNKFGPISSARRRTSRGRSSRSM